MPWLWYVLMLAMQVLGLSTIPLGLPGVWVQVLAAAVFGWITRWHYLGWRGLVAIAILAALAEGVEFLLGSAGAKQAGGGRRPMWGALAGGFLGAVFLTVPLPVIGTIIGACAGAFIGAFVGEYTAGGAMGHSACVGLGAAKGRLLGTLSKLLFGAAIFALTAVLAFP